jgi:hypothetical protein
MHSQHWRRIRFAIPVVAFVLSRPSFSAEPEPSLMAPPIVRGTTRVAGTTRPFFNLAGRGWGAISDVTIEHYLRALPLKLLASTSPLALAVEPDSTGLITHVRLGGGFYTDFIELTASAGGRYQRFGSGGYSLGFATRLGTQDGLHLRLDLNYAIVRNYYSGKTVIAFSNVMSAFQVPITHTVAMFAEAGFSFEVWAFVAAGLQHRFGPVGQPGTWSLRGGFGFAFVLDKFKCQFSDPSPCENAAWATGPTVLVGLDRRF